MKSCSVIGKEEQGSLQNFGNSRKETRYGVRIMHRQGWLGVLNLPCRASSVGWTIENSCKFIIIKSATGDDDVVNLACRAKTICAEEY